MLAVLRCGGLHRIRTGDRLAAGSEPEGASRVAGAHACQPANIRWPPTAAAFVLSRLATLRALTGRCFRLAPPNHAGARTSSRRPGTTRPRGGSRGTAPDPTGGQSRAALPRGRCVVALGEARGMTHPAIPKVFPPGEGRWHLPSSTWIKSRSNSERVFSTRLPNFWQHHMA